MKILIVLVFICIAINTSHVTAEMELVIEEHDVTPTNSSHASADTGAVKEDHDVTPTNSSHASADTEVFKEKHDVTPTNSSENVPMRPIFPKGVKKFIITTKPAIDNDTTPVHRPKKPVFKIVQKAAKMKNKNYWKSATKRPSLMKHIKFTVDPLTTSNRYTKRSNKHTDEDEAERKYGAEFRKMMKGKEDDSSEESSETDDQRKDKRKQVKTLVQRFHKLGSKINRKKSEDTKERIALNRHSNNNTGELKTNEGEFSSEEKEDKKEFIFVSPKKTEDHTKKGLEDSDESGEATTIIAENESKSQQKRSINVIEEENLGTTISGFKFTGKISSLSSNLVFRNINT